MASITDATGRFQSHNDLLSNKLASSSSGTSPVSDMHTRYLVLHSASYNICKMSQVTFQLIFLDISASQVIWKVLSALSAS